MDIQFKVIKIEKSRERERERFIKVVREKIDKIQRRNHRIVWRNKEDEINLFFIYFLDQQSVSHFSHREKWDTVNPRSSKYK